MNWNKNELEILARLGLDPTLIPAGEPIPVTPADNAGQAAGLGQTLAIMIAAYSGPMADLPVIDIAGEQVALYQIDSAERDIVALEMPAARVLDQTPGVELAESRDGLLFLRIPRDEMVVMVTPQGGQFLLRDGARTKHLLPFDVSQVKLFPQKLDCDWQSWLREPTKEWVPQFMIEVMPKISTFDGFAMAGLLTRHLPAESLDPDPAKWQWPVKSPWEVWVDAISTKQVAEVVDVALVVVEDLESNLQELDETFMPDSPQWREHLRTVCVRREFVQCALSSLANHQNPAKGELGSALRQLDTMAEKLTLAWPLSPLIPDDLLASVWVEDPDAWWGEWSGADRYT
jgi:hypothetical protein